MWKVRMSGIHEKELLFGPGLKLTIENIISYEGYNYYIHTDFPAYDLVANLLKIL